MGFGGTSPLLAGYVPECPLLLFVCGCKGTAVWRVVVGRGEEQNKSAALGGVALGGMVGGDCVAMYPPEKGIVLKTETQWYGMATELL